MNFFVQYKMDFSGVDIVLNEPTYGIFVKREKRFFVYFSPHDKIEKVATEDSFSVAYCPNVGKMTGLLKPGSKCLLSLAVNDKRKLKWTWEAVELDGQWIGINTQNPNALVEKLLKKMWPEEVFKSEVSFPGYRCDFASEHTVVEVKNVHWKLDDNQAFFPDCITQRGARQMLDLIELQKKRNYQCYVIYIVQRNDVSKCGVAGWIDQKYSQNVNLAKQAGVRFLAFSCDIFETKISVTKQIDVL